MSTKIQKRQAEKEKQAKAAQERKQIDFKKEPTVNIYIKSHNVIIGVKESKYIRLGEDKCITNWIDNFERRSV